MDALQIIFSPSVIGRCYLVAMYCAAVWVLVQQWASWSIIVPGLFLLLVFFYFEWQRYFALSASRPSGLRYCDKHWAICVAGEWQALESAVYYYRLPWIIVLQTVAYPSNQPELLYIWRDSLTVEQWRKLNSYLLI